MQRVAIARALIVEPKILVADEPTSNLDKATGESIIALFKRLAAEKGLAILITTHTAVFGHEADRAITLEDGRIVKAENLRLERGSAEGPALYDLRAHETFVVKH